LSTVKVILVDVYETLLHNKKHQWLTTFGEICRTQELPVDGEGLYRKWRTHDQTFREKRINPDDPSKKPPFTSYYEAWRAAFQRAFAGLGLPGDAEAAAQMTIDALANREAYVDVLEAMPLIQQRWRTGILSNADDAFLLPSIGHSGMEFEMVFSSEQGRSYKPDPGLFEEALRRMGIAASEAVYVGDTPNEDILGSKLAGMPVAWINRDGEKLVDSLPEPDYEISKMTELIPALESKG
jgi:2-haloalkanoic acid dehalogenase type II